MQIINKQTLSIIILLMANYSKAYIVNNNLYDLNNQDYFYDPPDHTKYAQMARYVVHKSDWTSMGTISTETQLKGFPMVNVISIADSPKNEKSTGNIYFLLTMMDFTGKDLYKDNRLTMLLSMDQDQYCTKRNVDPMEPTCARIMLSGNAIKLDNTTDEYKYGLQSMFSRHPAAQNWINAHDFYLCKLNISNIVVLDWYGGPHFVQIDDYYKANIKSYDNLEKLNYKFNKIQNFHFINRNDIETVKENQLKIRLPKYSNIKVINIEGL